MIDDDYDRISMRWDIYTHKLYIIADSQEWPFLEAPKRLQKICYKYLDLFKRTVTNIAKLKD